LSEVARQLIFAYYRNTGDLTSNLHELIQNYVDDEIIEIDEYYKGFSGKEFNPEIETEQLLEIFKTDEEFKAKSIEFYLIRQAYKFLGVNGNFDNCLKRGKQIEKTIPDKEPFPMVNKNLLFDFRDNDKSEFDLMQFAAYISIRSILGKKSYCKTNKEMIICRAFGYASKKQIPDKMQPVIKILFVKYMNRYHIDKVLQRLELNWNIGTYSNNMRGIYIFLKDKNKISYEQLIMIAETKKIKNKISELNKTKNEAKEKVLQQLNKGKQLNKEQQGVAAPFKF
jgi:hypothetical protein